MEVSISILTDFIPGEVIVTSASVEPVLQQLLNHLLRLSSNEAFFFQVEDDIDT